MEHHESTTGVLSVASPSQLTPPKPLLNFSGLPYDLRAEITRTAAVDATVEAEVLFMHSRSASRSLLLVNKEFSEVVTPFHWEHTVLINCETKSQLASVAHGMARHGSRVKELNMIHGDQIRGRKIKAKTRQRLYAEILSLAPNLSSITTSSEFALVLSNSIHLAALTRLTLHTFESSVPEHVAQLICRASNLAELSMYNYLLAHGAGDEIFEAMALSYSLTRLNLDYCSVLQDELFATNQWFCPITHLSISDDDEPTPSMASTLRTSLSYLAPTLLDLTLSLRFEIYDLSPPSPISLPHLASLTLIYDGEGVEHVELIPSLFRDSPIHTLTLISYSPWTDLEDLDALRPFVQAHKDTLKFIKLNVDYTRRADGQSLAAFAEELGVVLVDCSNPDDRESSGSQSVGYEEDEEDEWEDEEDGADGDDGEEWEGIQD